MITKTGFGYFVDSRSKKVGKFELPLGEHADVPGLTPVDVESKEALDDIPLEKSLQQLEKEEAATKKNALRNSAINKLKNVAGLTDDEINALMV